MFDFESIVLSGGGIRGFYLLGALDYFYDENPQTNKRYFNYSTIKEFRGTSVGSIICTLLAVGHTPREIFDAILDHDIFKPTSTHHLLEIMCKKSLMSIDALIRFVGEMMEEKGFYAHVTFDEYFLHTSKDIYITGTNFSNKVNKSVIFSRETTPDMPILKAVEISASAFPIFPLVSHRGDLYGDGGYTNNFFLEHSSPLRTLGVYLYSESSLNHESGLMEMLTHAVMTPIVEMTNQIIKRKNKNTLLVGVCAGDVSFFTVAIPKEEKIEMFKKGRLTAQDADNMREIIV